MLIRTRDTESCERQPLLLWDTIWVQRLDASGGYGDWLLAGAGDQPESRGGLRAESALHTATLLCLFTDRRLPEGAEHPGDDDDPRGWWGSSYRLEDEPEAELGSLLWTLERAVLTDETARRARAYAEDALAVIALQGAVARTDVAVELDRGRSMLAILVTHWDQAGTKAYEQRFGVLWTQSARGAPMNYGDR